MGNDDFFRVRNKKFQKKVATKLEGEEVEVRHYFLAASLI